MSLVDGTRQALPDYGRKSIHPSFSFLSRDQIDMLLDHILLC